DVQPLRFGQQRVESGRREGVQRQIIRNLHQPDAKLGTAADKRQRVHWLRRRVAGDANRPGVGVGSDAEFHGTYLRLRIVAEWSKDRRHDSGESTTALPCGYGAAG